MLSYIEAMAVTSYLIWFQVINISSTISIIIRDPLEDLLVFRHAAATVESPLLQSNHHHTDSSNRKKTVKCQRERIEKQNVRL